MHGEANTGHALLFVLERLHQSDGRQASEWNVKLTLQARVRPIRFTEAWPGHQLQAPATPLAMDAEQLQLAQHHHLTYALD